MNTHLKVKPFFQKRFQRLEFWTRVQRIQSKRKIALKVQSRKRNSLKGWVQREKSVDTSGKKAFSILPLQRKCKSKKVVFSKMERSMMIFCLRTFRVDSCKKTHEFQKTNPFFWIRCQGFFCTMKRNLERAGHLSSIQKTVVHAHSFSMCMKARHQRVGCVGVGCHKKHKRREGQVFHTIRGERLRIFVCSRRSSTPACV